MTSQQLYKRFISLCKMWPKDETKYGRDFGDHFRTIINSQFPHGEVSHVEDPKKLDEALSALERIANNNYYNENPLKRSSASGLEGWACKQVVSTDSLRALQEQDEVSLIKKLREALNVKFVSTNKKSSS